METPSHIAYKRVAIDLLKERGFSPNEIHEEHSVKYKVDGHMSYKIDVVGIRENRKVAIECGKTELSKLMNLRKIFDEVIVVGPEKIVELYDYWKGKYFTDTNKLKMEVNDLLYRIERVIERRDSEIQPLKDEIAELKTKIEKLQGKLRMYQKVISESCKMMKEQP